MIFLSALLLSPLVQTLPCGGCRAGLCSKCAIPAIAVGASAYCQEQQLADKTPTVKFASTPLKLNNGDLSPAEGTVTSLFPLVIGQQLLE